MNQTIILALLVSITIASKVWLGVSQSNSTCTDFNFMYEMNAGTCYSMKDGTSFVLSCEKNEIVRERHYSHSTNCTGISFFTDMDDGFCYVDSVYTCKKKIVGNWTNFSFHVRYTDSDCCGDHMLVWSRLDYCIESSESTSPRRYICSNKNLVVHKYQNSSDCYSPAVVALDTKVGEYAGKTNLTDLDYAKLVSCNGNGSFTFYKFGFLQLIVVIVLFLSV